jgi:hypothetical protein
MFKFVDRARRGCDKVTKVGVKWIIGKGDNNVGTETGSRGSVGVVSINDDGGVRFEGVELVYPRCRFCMFICEEIGYSGIRVCGNAFACRSRKTVSDRVVEEVIRVEMRAGGCV